MTGIEFPKLFKRTAGGKQQEWSVYVVDSDVHTVWGQTGGTLQTTCETILEGKNLGKANETTPQEQALKEAQSRWELKQKKGNYTQHIDDARVGKASDLVEGGVLPMLAKSWKDYAHKVRYPAFVQPKLDGHRCIAVVESGKCTLWSRTRKRITGVPHIERAIEEMSEGASFVLDGELYAHDYRDKFEELTSFIRQQTPKPGHEVVQYWVYDCVSVGILSADAQYEDRMLYLRHAVIETEPVVLVEATLVHNEDEVMAAFDEFVDQGFEGAMYRSADGVYVNKRSSDLLKVKEFDDAEFLCTGVKTGTGKMADKAIFCLQTPNGEAFDAKMKGALDDLRQYVDDPSLVVGKQVTVQYFGITANGVPRFPVALRIRKDV